MKINKLILPKQKKTVIVIPDHKAINMFYIYILDNANILISGASLVVQWLRLHAPNAGGKGSIPGQGTRFHMPQLRHGTKK